MFTALTGGYDAAAPEGKLAGWERVRHIVLTDAGGPTSLVGWRRAGWEVREVATGAATPRLAAKALKFGAHLYLPAEAHFALYVDATVRAVSWRPAPLLEICRRTGALWLLTPHGLHADDAYDEAFRVAQLQLEAEDAAFDTAALLATAGFPRRWAGPFGGAHRNASRRTSLTESVASFRNLRAPLLRAALGEVHGYLARGGTRRDQLLVDFARWRHQIPSLHLPLRLRARVLHDGYRHRYV